MFRYRITILCSACGAERCLQFEEFGRLSERELSRLAQFHGYVKVSKRHENKKHRGKWFCPTCYRKIGFNKG